MIVRFVTGNAGKLQEAAAQLASAGVQVEAAPAPVVEIQADSLEAVARSKAEQAAKAVRPPFFVEDAGLFIHALNGFPGVYSAPVYKTLGNQGVLRLLEGVGDRSAHFEAVIVFVDAARASHVFHGQVQGTIAPRADGEGGFGFDPIFIPTGAAKTFARLSPPEKAAVSHRGNALRLLARHLALQKG